MVQIRQKNKFQMSCMKSVETFFFKFKEQHRQQLSWNKPKNPSKILKFWSPHLGPLLKRETLFLFFHATGNPLVESTSNWSLFISNGVRFFL